MLLNILENAETIFYGFFRASHLVVGFFTIFTGEYTIFIFEAKFGIPPIWGY